MCYFKHGCIKKSCSFIAASFQSDKFQYRLSTHHKKEPTYTSSTISTSDFFTDKHSLNNKHISMELSMTPPSALSPPTQHSHGLTTALTSMPSDQHHSQIPVDSQLHQTNQLLLSNDHNGGQAQLGELPNHSSICHSAMDPSSSSDLVDHHMLSASDHSQTALSQHVRYTKIQLGAS